jgi:mannose-6-phosphate isomerase-like protein (cupin superfamily)
MKGFHSDIEQMTLQNSDFRHVLYTAPHSQLVLMSLRPNEEIGLEVHDENDQFFRFESGEGRVLIDGNAYEVKDGSAIVVPAGAEHNVVNTSGERELKLYTIYSPAHHRDGVVRATKAEAEADAPEYDGRNSE